MQEYPATEADAAKSMSTEIYKFVLFSIFTLLLGLTAMFGMAALLGPAMGPVDMKATVGLIVAPIDKGNLVVATMLFGFGAIMTAIFGLNADKSSWHPLADIQTTHQR